MAYPPLLTFAEAKAQIAKVVARSTDTNALTEAGEELQRVFEELSLSDWEFLLTSQDISIVAGTSDYNLNTNFRKVYSVRLVNGNRALAYIDQRTWDRVALDQTNPSSVYGYTLFPRTSNTQAQIRFVPVPGEVDTATVKYYRFLTVPTVDGTDLDILPRYQPWLIYQARANLLDAHDEHQQSQVWQARADRLLRKIQVEDRDQPDQTALFHPGNVAPFFPPDHPYAGWDGGWHY